MSTHEFTFGGVPCLVVARGVSGTAEMYVIVDDGAALRPIADRSGQPIQLMTEQDVDALGRAVRYLERRFGSQGEARAWAKPWWYLGRTILVDSPLRDGEQLP